MLHLSLFTAWTLAIAGGLPCAADEPAPARAGAPAAPFHPLEQGVGAEVNRALRLARDRGFPAAKVVEALACLGPVAIDSAILVLDQRKLPPIDGGKEQMLSEIQEARVLDALRRWNAGLVWHAVDAHLLTADGKPPALTARIAAILAAGTCARPEELMRVMACAGNNEAPELAEPIERAMLIAVEDVFRRHPEGLDGLSASWGKFPMSCLPAIIRGAGAVGDERILPFLEQMIDQAGDLEKLALAQLALQRAPDHAPAGLIEQLRTRLLDQDHPALCQAASTGLGALGDFGCVEELAVLLSTESAGVRANAYHALCSISGLRLPAQTSSWHAWRVHESSWFESRAAALEDAISDGDQRHASSALSELALHRWERHVLSDIAATALHRSEPELVEQACAVLTQLGSPRARAPLQAASEGEDPRCAEAARVALAAISKR
ncbi:MAG TPA: hypothetical protein VK843_08285 [Planctomycetota bacterium]|nr:hypothetical protein [Planctomycetota bacterium]